ncbi:hypothetical protein SCLCIDRAFT_1221366 [Scleroderma citrinum Foug A]|uniref:Cyclin N-terminal domain-containing protein n=1 Tax=Scleroderma citrinum Foug A TaxID=1036808 RepID=A0A0C3DGL7_9AGAM|nr:hypothetical protein SCLCIDRAFT_1221366 [Scleroderma citrinum Foug A]
MFYKNRSAILSSLTRLYELHVVTHRSLVDHIVDHIINAVGFSKGNSPSLYRPQSHLRESSLLRQFILRVLRLSHVPMGTVLIALAYVDQMKFRHTLDYGPATYERVFLGALILANQFIRDDPFATRQLEGYDLLFPTTEIESIETRFLFDFGFGALTIEGNAILDLYETFVEILENEKVFHHAYFQIDDHSCAGVTKFSPPHKEANVPKTKLRRPTWWRKLLHQSHLARGPISVH